MYRTFMATGNPGIDWMTVTDRKVPADFWSRAPIYPCFGLLVPEPLFVGLPLRTYVFAQDQKSFRSP